MVKIKFFIETRPEKTPDIIFQIVEQIDAIVKVTRFGGWQNSVSGPCEVQKAYNYIQEHYDVVS